MKPLSILLLVLGSLSMTSPSRKADQSYVPTTVVVAVAVLFEVSGSLGLPVTVAVLLIAPGLVGLTTIVIVAEPPLESAPTAQVTVPPFGSFFFAVDRVHVPWVEDTDRKIAVLGKG